MFNSNQHRKRPGCSSNEEEREGNRARQEVHTMKKTISLWQSLSTHPNAVGFLGVHVER